MYSAQRLEARRIASRKWIAKNRETERQRLKEYHARKPERAKHWRQENMVLEMYGRLVRRARDREQECPLTIEQLADLMRPMICSVTGLRLRWDMDRPRDPLAPSVDKIDPEGLYEIRNVRLTSFIYNQARNTFSDEEIVEYIVWPLSEES